jgi:hypothetical protein
MNRAAGLFGLLATLCAAPAFAADADATLEIRGRISPRCAVEFSAAAVHVDLTDSAGSEQVPFSVDCNQPLVVHMTSHNGGLMHSSHKSGVRSPGFTSLLRYTATFSVDAGNTRPVAFESDRMMAGASGSIGAAPYRAQGSLDLNWTPEAPLLGGRYGDVIEIRVSGEGETGSPG